MFDFLFGWPWWGYALAGVVAFAVAGRLISALFAFALLGGLAVVAIAAIMGLFSVVGPMFSQSFGQHQSNRAAILGYDSPAERAQAAPTVCPRYHQAGFVRRFVSQEMRDLSWCADYE